jgi:phosphatidylglycerophosphate synthase
LDLSIGHAKVSISRAGDTILRYTWLAVVQGITASRAAMAVVLVYTSFRGTPAYACLLFAVMLVSDVCDGVAARALRVTSRGGAWLDTLADRCVAVSCVLIGLQAGISPVIAVLFLAREMLFASLVGIIPPLSSGLRDRILGHFGGVPLRAAAGCALLARAVTPLSLVVETFYLTALAVSLTCIPFRLWSKRSALLAMFTGPNRRAIRPPARRRSTPLSGAQDESFHAKS